ncbi:MAG: PAS domain S-box protein [Bryobacteraceae bacterium]
MLTAREQEVTPNLAAETPAAVEIQSSLRQTLAKLDTALGAMTEAMVWTDPAGRIEGCNKSFLQLVGKKSLYVIGKPVTSVLPLSRGGHPVDVPAHPVSRVLDHHEPVAGPLYEFSHFGVVRILEIQAHPLTDRRGRCALLMIRDLTESKLAEHWLEKETARLDLLQKVAEAANESASPEEAMDLAVRLLCRHAGWPVGHVYLTDSGMTPSGIWYVEDEARYGLFRRATESLALMPGQDLPGRVRNAGLAMWFDDVTAEDGLRSKPAAACGLRTAFCFPILAKREVMAVVEMYTGEPVDRDERLIRVAEQVGTQLGRLFERRQSYESLVRAKRQLESRVEERNVELRKLNQALLNEIKDREKVQLALRDAATRFRNLVHTVQDVIFSISGPGRLDSLNPAFQNVTGFQAADWLGVRAIRLIHPEDRRYAIDQMARLASGDAVPAFEIRILTASGKWAYVECSISRQEQSRGVTGIFGVARDITERRKAGEELLLRDRAMASTSEGISITDASDPNMPFLYANSGFVKLTGYGANEVLGRTWRDFRSEATSKGFDNLWDAMTLGASCMEEVKILRKDDSEFWGRISVTPVRDGSGNLTHYVGILSDITQQKEAERVKNDLLSTVSHELRTPLTSLRGFAELMLEREFPPERRRKFIEIIHKESTRLSNLINDFLDLQRIESGRQTYKFVPVRLDKMVQETIEIFRGSGTRHQFSVVADAGLPMVMADADRIRQVLTNLISNAVKFAPNGGPIMARLQLVEEGPQRFVEVAVADRGMGMSQETISKLFQKFFRADNTETRKIGGTGLGLALVKQMVEAHHGKIWVESTPGSGSTFFFTLPVAS